LKLYKGKSIFPLKLLSKSPTAYDFNAAESLQLKINAELDCPAIYRPPSGCKKVLIDEHLKSHASRRWDFVIVGDLNLNLMDHRDTNITKIPCQRVASTGAFSFALRKSLVLVDFHQRWWIMFTINSTNFTICQQSWPQKVSDHCATCSILIHIAERERAPPKFVDKINFKEVNKMLKLTNWGTNIRAEASVHEACSKIADKMYEIKAANLERIFGIFTKHFAITQSGWPKIRGAAPSKGFLFS
jgi:hypothetical protein